MTVRIECITVTLSAISGSIGFIALFITCRWFAIAAVGMTVAYAVLGNILALTRGVRVAEYIGISEKKVALGNILGHIVYPLIILVILCMKQKKEYIPLSDYLKAIAFAFSIGIIYIILMTTKCGCTYGLTNKELVGYGVSWILIVAVISYIFMVIYSRKKR